MSPQSIESRLEKLEQRVTVLERIPARIDGLTLQIVQLREEMHAAISASAASVEASLREEIRAGNDKIMSQARTLYEDMNAKLALIEEGRSSSRRRRPRE